MKRSWRVVEAAVVLLFWQQAARVLFSTLFGVIYDALFDEELSMGTVGLIFAFLLVALCCPAVLDWIGRRSGTRSTGHMGMLVAALLTAVARVPLSLNNPQLRLASAIVIMGAAGLYLGFLLRKRVQLFPVAMVLALTADQIARAYGDTWDFSLQPVYLPLQIVLCLGLIAIAWTVYARRDQPALGDDESGATPCLELSGGLALGSFLFLQTAVLAQPNVVARWSGLDYALLAPALLLMTVLPLLPVSGSRFELFGGYPLHWLRQKGVLFRLLVSALTLILFTLGRQIDGFLSGVALLLVQLLLVTLLPLVFSRPVACERQRPGLGLALGMLAFLVLHLAYAFAFTYPYTVPQFRNAGLPIMLIATAITFLPAVLQAPEVLVDRPAPINNQLVMLFGMVFIAIMIWAQPDQFAAVEINSREELQVATYNIHYGYDSDWRHTLEDQAQAIEQSGADVVFLQEVDAGRPTSYGVDNALWLARRLGMEAVFAPALEGLSGVALLTRLPVVESDWSLLPSELEQTALVHARLLWGGQELDAYGVWLGLDEDERMRQLSAALEIMPATGTVVFGGDLNSEPDSLVYQALVDADLVDPFVVTENLPAYSSPAVGPDHRIDYVWVKGLEVDDAMVSSSLASDHRMVVVSVRPVEPSSP